MLKVSSTSLQFTAADRKAAEQRQGEIDAELARMAAADSVEEMEEIADRSWRRSVERLRAIRRARATRRRAAPVVTTHVRPREREHRPAETRRSSSSSRTSGSDPGDDPDPDPEHSLRPIGDVLDRYVAELRERAA